MCDCDALSSAQLRAAQGSDGMGWDGMSSLETSALAPKNPVWEQTSAAEWMQQVGPRQRGSGRANELSDGFHGQGPLHRRRALHLPQSA